jgi:Cysteine rich repeat
MTFSQKALLVALMAAVLGFVFWTVPAAAAAAQDKVCADDARRLCSDVQAGRGNVMNCLKAHEADLSAACKDRIQAAQSRAQSAQGTIQACQSDAARFCANVPPGRGSVASCLKQHESELSAECKAGLSQARTRRAPQR